MNVGDVIGLPEEPPYGSVVGQDGVQMTRTGAWGWERERIDEIDTQHLRPGHGATSWADILKEGPVAVIRVGWPDAEELARG